MVKTFIAYIFLLSAISQIYAERVFLERYTREVPGLVPGAEAVANIVFNGDTATITNNKSKDSVTINSGTKEGTVTIPGTSYTVPAIQFNQARHTAQEKVNSVHPDLVGRIDIVQKPNSYKIFVQGWAEKSPDVRMLNIVVRKKIGKTPKFFIVGNTCSSGDPVRSVLSLCGGPYNNSTELFNKLKEIVSDSVLFDTVKEPYLKEGIRIITAMGNSALSDKLYGEETVLMYWVPGKELFFEYAPVRDVLIAPIQVLPQSMREIV